MRNNLILLLAIFTLTSCNGQKSEKTKENKPIEKGTSLISNSKDDLIGEFALRPNGKAEIKILKEKGKYFVQINKKGKWGSKTELNNTKDNEVEKVFGSNWNQYVEYGLAKTGFGIFKVKKGYSTEKRTFKTGYFLYYMMATDIYKLN